MSRPHSAWFCVYVCVFAGKYRWTKGLRCLFVFCYLLNVPTKHRHTFMVRCCIIHWISHGLLFVCVCFQMSWTVRSSVLLLSEEESICAKITDWYLHTKKLLGQFEPSLGQSCYMINKAAVGVVKIYLFTQEYKNHLVNRLFWPSFIVVYVIFVGLFSHTSIQGCFHAVAMSYLYFCCVINQTKNRLGLK